MDLGGWIDRVRKASSALAGRAGSLVRRSGSRKSGAAPASRNPSGPGAPAPGEPDGLDDLLSGSVPESPGAEDGFPGFAPAPGLGDRVRASTEALAGRIRGNPRALLAAGGGLLALGLALLAVSAILRPPRPVTPAPSVPAEALGILRRIPVPRLDPLEEESSLDRPRKDRYTEEDVVRMWRDLGLLPVEDLRDRNRAELRDLFSALEKR